MKVQIVLYSTTLAVFLFSANIAYSAPHISDKYRKYEPRIKPKALPDVSHLKAKRAPRKVIALTLGTIGVKKLAVIIVDFQDQFFSSTWHSQTQQVFDQFKNYFNEVSYGQLQVDVTFFYNGGSTKTLTGTETPYRMPRRMSYYAQNTEESLAQLVKDAILAAGVHKSTYDYVMVLHAGYGAESVDRPIGYIWSAYVSWQNPVNGFTDGTIVPEEEYGNMSPLGVVCHEFGHQLGLPDLYYDQRSVVGVWCLMDAGCWLGYPAGSQPGHLSVWCKDFLGWLDVEIVSYTKRNVQLPYIESSSTAIKVEILTADDPQKEYFLLEYRKKISFDASLPGEGLLIWRIDDNIAKNQDRLQMNDINSGIPHLGVDLIEADRTVINEFNTGDKGDPFFTGMRFIPCDYDLMTFNGRPISVFITNINIVDNYAEFNVLYHLEMKQLASGEVRIGNNYTYAGRLMTIGFNLPQEGEVEILVYNVFGNLVKNFGKNFYPKGMNTIQWWTIDENNQKLSPGVYFVVVKGSSIHKVEKFIIKR